MENSTNLISRVSRNNETYINSMNISGYWNLKTISKFE